MSRNFGLGSRDMCRAVAYANSDAVQSGDISFKTANAQNSVFREFSDFSRQNGAKYLEYVSRETVTQYGQQLADRVSNGEIKQGHAQNIVSALNSIMNRVTGGRWERVSPTRDCGIDQRSHVRETPPTGLDRAGFERAISALDARSQTVATLARDLGLRTKEASLFDAKSALREYEKTGKISVSDGTKGGRPRQIPIQKTEQFQTLIRSAEVQGTAKSVMPADQNWKNWQQNGLRNIRESLQKQGITRLHDLRSAYACERYRQLTGHDAPVCGGKAPRDVDRAARQQIAEELGHGRIAITNTYLGKS